MNFIQTSLKCSWPFSRLPRATLLCAITHAALCLPAGHAWASSGLDELLADQVSVRELMRLETAQVLHRVRNMPGYGPNRDSRARAGHPAAQMGTGAMRLVAIYGVGRKLMAEVQIDGQSLLFMRGRLQAIGPGKAHEMRLLSMNSRCVELALGERRESLCAPASHGLAE